MKSMLKKTAVATAAAGVLTLGAMIPAQAEEVINSPGFQEQDG